MSSEQVAELLEQLQTIKVLLCLLVGAFMASAMRPRRR